MEKQIIRQALPSLVANLANWFEIDFSIKLFGVTVFQFHFPPKENEDSPTLKTL